MVSRDGSAVAIAHAAGQRINRVGGGTIWVAGFNDPAEVAGYMNTPSTARPDYLHNPSATASWPNDLVTATKLLASGTIDFYPNPYEFLGHATAGANDLGEEAYALGAPNIIHADGINASGPGGVPQPYVHDDATAFAFDYRDNNGKNLNMRVIKDLYGINDGDDFYIRAVAFDVCYQGRPDWAVPLCLNTDSTAPVATIPADLLGTDPICDVIMTDNDDDGFPDNATYTIEATVPDEDIPDVAVVDFFQWNPTTEMWDAIGSDSSPPYQVEYEYPGPLSNDPPALRDTLHFRAVATDQFGNTEPFCGGYMGADSLWNFDDGAECWELMVEVVDCGAPMSCICQIGYDYDPSDGALVPSENAVDISAWFTDGDGDPTTNDVTRVIFEYRLIGSQTWMPLESLTGVNDSPDSLVSDVTGIHHPVIATGPDTLKATVTWNTTGLPAGSYDLRAYAVDIEGNSNPHMACVFTATVDNIGLRAYVQPCVFVDDNTDSLFSNVYIHDVAVASVQFQFYEDTDGNGIDDDGNTWFPIDTVGVGSVDTDPKGDVVLRAGTVPVNHVKDATYRALSGSLYRFIDVDGDGYNPVDPVIRDANNNGQFDGGDVIVIATGYTVNSGDLLTDFAIHEYYADQNGDNLLTSNEWILLDNVLNGGADNDVNLWCTEWDTTGLIGCYLVRTVAVDQLGNTDDDDDSDGVPDSSPTEIWTEECCYDSDTPVFCVTSYVSADGDTVAVPGHPDCDWVAAQDSLTFIAEVEVGGDPADIDSVVFQYSLDQGFTWDTFCVDEFAVDGWSCVFDYASWTLTTDTQFNFRALAYKNGVRASDPNSCKVCLVLGENQGPETDIVWLTTAEGDTLISNTVLRGNLDPFCLDPTTLSMLVTAEDGATIDSVWMMHKKVAGTSASDTTDWMKVVDGITPTADEDYPYEFNWDISSLTDGVYAFFPRAIDSNGNVTPTFGNPFYFSMSGQSARVVTAERIGVEAEDLVPGEEIVLKAELEPDPSDTEGIRVKFYYAERIEGEVLTVRTVPPFTANTAFDIYSNSVAGMHGSETVYVNGAPATYHEAAGFRGPGCPDQDGLHHLRPGRAHLRWTAGSR